MKAESAIEEIIQEYQRATIKFGGFASTHEGYAILLEEVDELWTEIKCNGSKENMKKEATQVAAMAFRFLVDCC